MSGPKSPLFGQVFAAAVVTITAVAVTADPRPNILVLVVDDLNGYALREDVHTPHLDALKASSGAVSFVNAYAQQAVCGPSRSSFLTGRRPAATRAWNFLDSFRERGVDRGGLPGANWSTLPSLFKNAGYRTQGMGKVFHPQQPAHNDQPTSWSQQYPYFAPPGQIFQCCNGTWAAKPNYACSASVTGSGGWPTVCDLPDEQCVDRQLSLAAAAALGNLTAPGAGPGPFALFVGFRKPHPDWSVPARFAAMYEDFGLAPNQLAPADMPPVAFYSCDYTQAHADVGGAGAYSLGNTPLPAALQHKIRAGYLGAVTWVDQQIGGVIDSLAEVGAAGSTVVVVVADHGWSLGEHGMWCKQGNFEEHLRVPLIIRDPRGAVRPGSASTELVELVDLLPSLAELAGVPLPPHETFDGDSFAPLVRGRPRPAPKLAAFSQYPRCLNTSKVELPPHSPGRDACSQVPSSEFTHMGFTMRTATARYTEWVRWNGTAAVWHSQEGVELYRHPGAEDPNLALRPDHRDMVARLSLQLRAAFGGPPQASRWNSMGDEFAYTPY